MKAISAKKVFSVAHPQGVSFWVVPITKKPALVTVCSCHFEIVPSVILRVRMTLEMIWSTWYCSQCNFNGKKRFWKQSQALEITRSEWHWEPGFGQAVMICSCSLFPVSFLTLKWHWKWSGVLLNLKITVEWSGVLLTLKITVEWSGVLLTLKITVE